MNLTEPQAGSDLGAVRTMARPLDDGSWAITGTKIFITYGDHQMVDNIVHLVLARTPDAPPGSRGISLFAVQTVPGIEDGDLTRNNVTTVSVEHKLGIHASPTCVLSFEDARGELVGELNGGLRAMFTMMNRARVGVGIEGVGISEAAYQLALSYALEREQSRKLGDGPADPPAPIAEHLDVKRMLLSMRSRLDAMRALLFTTAHAVDMSEQHPDDEVKARYAAKAAFLTPLAKAWPTDAVNEITSTAIQIHGGMGFVEESGAAQHYRDARITGIYEGTNGIQALDLVTRKMAEGPDSAFARTVAEVEATVADLRAGGHTAVADRLAAAVADLRGAGEWILRHSAQSPADVLAGATPFLRLAAYTVAGGLLARQAYGPHGDDVRRASAAFFATEYLPTTAALRVAVEAGADLLEALPPAQLASR
jgi:acyl-CoA dehydrogenase